MTIEAPERIWLWPDLPHDNAPQYIRDDLHQKALDRIEELEAVSALAVERLRIAIERAEKAEDERDALRAELRGLWSARMSQNTPVVDTILGVPLEDIFEKIIRVAEESDHENEKGSP